MSRAAQKFREPRQIHGVGLAASMAQLALPVALCTACGLLLALHFPQLRNPLVVAIGIGVVACLFCRQQNNALLLLAALVGLGFANAQFNAFKTHRLPAERHGSVVVLEGRVQGLVSNKNGRTVFDFEPGNPVQFDQLTHHNWQPRLLRVSDYNKRLAIAADERWRLKVKLRAPTSLGNPGSFDLERWMFSKRIDAFATVVQSDDSVRLSAARWWSGSSLRTRVRAALQGLAKTHPANDLAIALAIGDTSALSKSRRHLLRDTGTSHLVAISGLHIGLVASLGFGLGALLWKYLLNVKHVVSLPVLGFAFAVIGATGYAWLAGFSLPTLRALIMLLVFSTIKVAQLRPKPYRVLGVAMVLILAMDPLASLSAGFWLSFGTVAFIVFCCHGYLKPQRRFREAVRLHVILGLFTLPLGAWFFQSGSVVAPLANLVVIPLVSLLIVPLILISILLLGVLPSMAAWFYVSALELLSLMVAGLSLLQSMGGAISLSLSTLAVFVLCMIGVLVLLLPLNWHVRWLALVMVLPAVLQAGGVRQSADELELHVLDVGQGQSILLIHKNRVILYDTGGVLGRDDTMFDAVVMPFLLQSGYRHIDHAIISHADQDHAAGVESLRRHFPDIDIAASDPDALPVSGVSPCESGQQWTFNAVRMTVLQPAHFDEWSDNDRSCVVLVEFGHSKILLTGDIEALAERRLASRLGQFPVDVMTSPHHGSATSSTDHLLNTFRPRFVVVSSGWRNAYGFPHREVQMRYKLAGINMLVTGLQGALSFRFDELGLKEPPSGHWQKQTQPWHEVRELGALIK